MKMTRIAAVLPLVSLCLVPVVSAAPPVLIAVGTMSPDYEDFATQTAGPLENGIPGNRLGGVGSGLAYLGGDFFIGWPRWRFPRNSSWTWFSVGAETRHTLYLSNDNDYTSVAANSHHASGTADNPNQWFVFAFDDSDLPGFVPQRFRRFEDDDDHGDHDDHGGDPDR